MKKLIISVAIFLAVTYFSISTNAQVKSEIEKANKAGKIVFLVVTDGDNGLAKAKTIAEKAKTLYSKSSVAFLDRKSKTNSELVKKYRLSGAPVPLVLVIATNGYVAGGTPTKEGTAEELIKMIPTPKQAELIKAFNEGKSAFVVISKKSIKDKSNALDECNNASKQMNNKAVVISIDLEDKTEESFLNKLNINRKDANAKVLVFNSQGQLMNMMSESIKASDLVQAANKKAGGCCPPGSGKTCPPKK